MRSVIRRRSSRCPRCQLTLRWCVCAAARPIATPLALTLLTHPREATRPSSTGNLIQRLFTGCTQALWDFRQPPRPQDLLLPGRDLWILHPQGQPLPPEADPAQLQVMLIDGAWTEAATMAKEVKHWGRLVSLPLTGASRFWLRAKQDAERYSTAEALLFLLKRLGLHAAEAALRAQFELLVYAALRARGRTDLAARFLENSVLNDAMPEQLAQLQARRPLEGSGSDTQGMP
ncbi:MAG: DTW domain-containing protein [Pseudomonadales bacterium]|jgi:DTW domain-containing protein YfiP|nr:DTW domain-containing protein [Pseudomonadales bacterium]